MAAAMQTSSFFFRLIYTDTRCFRSFPVLLVLSWISPSNRSSIDCYCDNLMRHPHTNLRLRNGHKNEWNICNVVTFLNVHPRSKNEAKVSHSFAVRFYVFLWHEILFLAIVVWHIFGNVCSFWNLMIGTKAVDINFFNRYWYIVDIC